MQKILISLALLALVSLAIAAPEMKLWPDCDCLPKVGQYVEFWTIYDNQHSGYVIEIDKEKMTVDRRDISDSRDYLGQGPNVMYYLSSLQNITWGKN